MSTHTQPSCGMLTVFISAEALGNKAWSFSVPRPNVYFCLPNKHQHKLGRDAGPRAPSSGEPAELWLMGWRVTAYVYLLQCWLYLMWQWGWSIMAKSMSQRDKYWGSQVPQERFKMLWCTNQFVVKRAYCNEMCPPFWLCMALRLTHSQENTPHSQWTLWKNSVLHLLFLFLYAIFCWEITTNQLCLFFSFIFIILYCHCSVRVA